MFENNHERNTEQILSGIQEADEKTLDEITKAIIHRRNILFPEWELFLLSLPKNDLEERRRILAQTMEFLEHHDQI